MFGNRSAILPTTNSSTPKSARGVAWSASSVSRTHALPDSIVAAVPPDSWITSECTGRPEVWIARASA